MSFDPVPPPAHAAPRLREVGSNAQRLSAGAAARAALSRSRELHPSRRLSPEQRELRDLVRAQERVGRCLEPLERAGSAVLHARRAPSSAFDLDHVVVTTGAVLVISDAVSTRQAPIALDGSGSVIRARLSLARRQDLLRSAAEDVARGCGDHLPAAWSVLVVPVMVVVGPTPLHTPLVSRGLTVLIDELIARWTVDTFPATVDLLGSAQISAAVESTCSPAVSA